MSDLAELKIRMQFMFHSLPSSEKAAAAYLIDNLTNLGDAQLNTISQRTKLSSSTFIRFLKRLGYNGFLDFREEVREGLSELPSQSGVGLPAVSIRQQMSTIIEKNRETMENTLALVSEQYEGALAAMQKANVIVMFGNGDAIIPCDLIKIKLMKIGKTCVTYSDQDLQVFCASTIHAGDVVMAVSHTGRSKSVVEAMSIAQERGAITIGVTATAKSPLLKYCQYVLYAGTVDETDADDVITRRVAEQTILETLYMCMVMNINGEIAHVKKQGVETIQKMMKIPDAPAAGAALFAEPV